mgnify:CR=1 FL=1
MEERSEAGQPSAVDLGERIVVPLNHQNDMLVDIQQILQNHSITPTEVEAVAVGEQLAIEPVVGLAEQLAEEAGVKSVVSSPKKLGSEDVEKLLIDSLLGPMAVEQPQEIVLLESDVQDSNQSVDSKQRARTDGTSRQEDGLDSNLLEARRVTLPRVAPVEDMMRRKPARSGGLSDIMNMSNVLLVARAENQNDSAAELTTPKAINQAEGAPVDPQPEFWPRSPQLQRQLKQLSTIESLTDWAGDLIKSLDELYVIRGLGSVESVRALATLRDLHEKGKALISSVPAGAPLQVMQKTLAGLDTRLEIWHAVQTIISNQNVSVDPPDFFEDQVAVAIEGIEERLVGSEAAENWRDYLELDELRRYMSSEDGVDVAARGKQAQRVLVRMHARSLTAEQKSLLQEEAFTSLELGLRQWCVEPADYPKLMRDIELFESSRYNYRAVPVANTFQVIRWSLDDNVARLGAMLEERYRAGNIRIRIAQDFINRMIPSETQTSAPIEDKVLGALVEGTSDTTSRLKVQLLEDDGRWVIGLDAQGEIESRTTSTKGAAVFENEASASYQANKKIMISPSGIEFGETLADVQSESKLVNFETEYDNSLLGGIARNMARNQYKQKEKSAAKAMDLRIREQATDTLDDKVTEQMAKMEQTYQSRWLEPMQDLNLRPVATQLHTADDKLAIDYRLAGIHQLAAHGFRPEIPQQTLVGIQVHESALNNLLHNLDLDGKSGKLIDVMQRIADQLGVENFTVPVDVPETVMVRFMERESIRIRFYQSKVQLMIQMRQLQNKRLGWRNFAILAEYAPSSDAINGTLQRQGVIQILGNGLRLGDRIALQTIFNKVLPSTQTLSLLSESIVQHPNMGTAEIELFEINQGWLTFAVTDKKRVAATVEDKSER